MCPVKPDLSLWDSVDRKPFNGQCDHALVIIYTSSFPKGVKTLLRTSIKIARYFARGARAHARLSKIPTAGEKATHHHPRFCEANKGGSSPGRVSREVGVGLSSVSIRAGGGLWSPWCVALTLICEHSLVWVRVSLNDAFGSNACAGCNGRRLWQVRRDRH